MVVFCHWIVTTIIACSSVASAAVTIPTTTPTTLAAAATIQTTTTSTTTENPSPVEEVDPREHDLCIRNDELAYKIDDDWLEAPCNQRCRCVFKTEPKSPKDFLFISTTNHKSNSTNTEIRCGLPLTCLPLPDLVPSVDCPNPHFIVPQSQEICLCPQIDCSVGSHILRPGKLVTTTSQTSPPTTTISSTTNNNNNNNKLSLVTDTPAPILGCRSKQPGGRLLEFGVTFNDECHSTCRCYENGEIKCQSLACPTNPPNEPYCAEWELDSSFQPNSTANECCAPFVCKRQVPKFLPCLWADRTFEHGSIVPKDIQPGNPECDRECTCRDSQIDCKPICPDIGAWPPESLKCAPGQAQKKTNDCCEQWHCRIYEHEFQEFDVQPINATAANIRFVVPSLAENKRHKIELIYAGVPIVGETQPAKSPPNGVVWYREPYVKTKQGNTYQKGGLKPNHVYWFKLALHFSEPTADGSPVGPLESNLLQVQTPQQLLDTLDSTEAPVFISSTGAQSTNAPSTTTSTTKVPPTVILQPIQHIRNTPPPPTFVPQPISQSSRVVVPTTTTTQPQPTTINANTITSIAFSTSRETTPPTSTTTSTTITTTRQSTPQIESIATNSPTTANVMNPISEITRHEVSRKKSKQVSQFKTCHIMGRTLSHGDKVPEEIHPKEPDCEKECFCQDGRILCHSICPSITDLPPENLNCAPEQAFKVTSECCPRWQCRTDAYELQDFDAEPINATAVNINIVLPDFAVNRRGRIEVNYTGVSMTESPGDWPPAEAYWSRRSNIKTEHGILTKTIIYMLPNLKPNYVYWFKLAVYFIDKAEPLFDEPIESSMLRVQMPALISDALESTETPVFVHPAVPQSTPPPSTTTTTTSTTTTTIPPTVILQPNQHIRNTPAPFVPLISHPSKPIQQSPKTTTTPSPASASSTSTSTTTTTTTTRQPVSQTELSPTNSSTTSSVINAVPEITKPDVSNQVPPCSKSFEKNEIDARYTSAWTEPTIWSNAQVNYQIQHYAWLLLVSLIVMTILFLGACCACLKKSARVIAPISSAYDNPIIDVDNQNYHNYAMMAEKKNLDADKLSPLHYHPINGIHHHTGRQCLIE